MKDRRSIARFALEVPARVEILKESGEREILQLRTKNISASGAFLYSPRPLPQGRLSMEIVLCVKTLKQILRDHRDVRLTLSGNVVRVENAGIAVKFSKKYLIQPIPKQP